MKKMLIAINDKIVVAEIRQKFRIDSHSIAAPTAGMQQRKLASGVLCYTDL